MRSATSGELAELVKDLRAQVAVLEPHLTREAAADEPTDTRLKNEYTEAFAAKRTAAGYDEWLEGRVTQTAAAWVLATVVVRYCEDSQLIEHPLICGPGGAVRGRGGPVQRLVPAARRPERHRVPARRSRAAVCDAPDCGELVRRAAQSLVWDIPLRYEAAGALLAFWRRRGPDGEVRWRFEGRDTRFLGDLYQDLSEFARKQYALLQTPEFVESFILDLTLTPAIEDFGLEGLRTIDPTAGSDTLCSGSSTGSSQRGVRPSQAPMTGS